MLENFTECKDVFFAQEICLKKGEINFYMNKGCQVASDLWQVPTVFIGFNCIIYPKVMIGDYTMLVSVVEIIGGDHWYDIVGCRMIFSGRDKQLETIIGKMCGLVQEVFFFARSKDR